MIPAASLKKSWWSHHGIICMSQLGYKYQLGVFKVQSSQGWWLEACPWWQYQRDKHKITDSASRAHRSGMVVRYWILFCDCSHSVGCYGDLQHPWKWKEVKPVFREYLSPEVSWPAPFPVSLTPGLLTHSPRPIKIRQNYINADYYTVSMYSTCFFITEQL